MGWWVVVVRWWGVSAYEKWERSASCVKERDGQVGWWENKKNKNKIKIGAMGMERESGKEKESEKSGGEMKGIDGLK